MPEDKEPQTPDTSGPQSDSAPQSSQPIQPANTGKDLPPLDPLTATKSEGGNIYKREHKNDSGDE